MSRAKIGDVLVAQGKLSAALAEYREALAERQRLANIDPTNTHWQSRLLQLYLNVGDVLVAQGGLADALKAFGEGLAIRERLTLAEPTNIGSQRDLSAAHDKIGDVLRRVLALSSRVTCPKLSKHTSGDWRSRPESLAPIEKLESGSIPTSI